MSQDRELWLWLMLHPVSLAARGGWVDLNFYLADLRANPPEPGVTGAESKPEAA